MRFSCIAALVCALTACTAVKQPANRWVEVRNDMAGARPGSAIRYVPDAHAFVLWGYMNDDPDLLQEQPLMRIPEYDVVAFRPEAGRWENQIPDEWESLWSKQLPLAYSPRTYSGITSGAERTVLRGATTEKEGAPRPDLNLAFDQVVWVPTLRKLVYFTGGLTAAYDPAARRWTDLTPKHSPPPVFGGSLAYDPVHDEIVLFGGGHVAEPGPGGKVVGYTGTWIFSPRENDWRQLPAATLPPSRMNTRMVTDARDQKLILFGGDSQSHYLADTWIFDLRTRSWSESKLAGPQARAGHFAVYDTESGWMIIGGGYGRKDLTDMWAYDPRANSWHMVGSDVPIGFYLTADIAPEKRLIVLATSTRKPNDRMTCNILFPVRTTYEYRIENPAVVTTTPMAFQQPVPKRADETHPPSGVSHLENLPENQWVLLAGPGRAAPTRTWGTATFDSDREQILYWGGGHCGYGGNDVDMYDVAHHTWRSSDPAPEYPERLWNHGVREAGVTFGGRPWMEHGRRIYAYDPVSHKMIVTRRLRLTTGYEPAICGQTPKTGVAPDALVNPPSSHVRFLTWEFDPNTSKWDLAGPAPPGVDTLVSTPKGVMGINVDWPARLNDAGYQFPWTSASPHQDTAIFLYHAAGRRWERLNNATDPSPQNLYEQTSLAYDSKRNQVILHGGGLKRDELWTFDLASRRWRNMQPKGDPDVPAGSREAVYLPHQDVFLTSGRGAWIWNPAENAWRRVEIPFFGTPPQVGENRAMVYDVKRDLIFLVLGERGDDGLAQVYALRYNRK
ncbi:MAG TPA: kelch repeat-containing protein [Bryobacteraceae bacterium]|nr:kelch repeat-containing protein [Bryobacteraceae bacterium]